MTKVNVPKKGAGRRLAASIKNTDKILDEILQAFDDKVLMRQRKAANKKLLSLLKKFMVENPEQRFGQALRNAGFIASDHTSMCHDEFYVESHETLKRVKITLAGLKEHHR